MDEKDEDLGEFLSFNPEKKKTVKTQKNFLLLKTFKYLKKTPTRVRSSSAVRCFEPVRADGLQLDSNRLTPSEKVKPSGSGSGSGPY